MDIVATCCRHLTKSKAPLAISTLPLSGNTILLKLSPYMASTPQRERDDLEVHLGKACDHLLDCSSVGFFLGLCMSLLTTVCSTLETHLNLAALLPCVRCMLMAL